MAEKRIKKRSFGGAPAVDFLDLGYFMPLMTAGALKGSPSFPFTYGLPLRMASTAMQSMGRIPRWFIYERFITSLMANRYEAEDVKSETFARWVVKQYEGRRYPFVVIGPTLGSLVYLASALDAPFLPMNYSLAIRHPRMHPDEKMEHIDVATKRAEYFLKQDRNVEVIHEYDPVHQRFRTRNASLLRFRMLTLPEAYRKFIRTHVQQNGVIVFIESRIGWRQYKLDNRLFHQIGSPGGIPCDEYITGSRRLDMFSERFLQEKVSYRLPLPNELQPESHYGVTPGNRMDVIRAANDLRRDLCQLFTDDIYQLNSLVSKLFLLCARREGHRPGYCFVHSGTFLSPYWCLQSLIIPIWVPSPCYPALQFVRNFVGTYPCELKQILLAFEPSIEEAPDFLMLDRWREALEPKGSIRYIGMNPKSYPREVNAFFRYWPTLSKWASRRKQPLEMRITLHNILQEAENCDIKFQVTENR